jgi:diguanylate cyclase (GGDEF)-like protein
VDSLLRDQVRRAELLARYGGEEFVLLLTGTGPAAPQEVCERLRRAIETYGLL